MLSPISLLVEPPKVNGKAMVLLLVIASILSSTTNCLRIATMWTVPGQNVTSAEASCPAVSVLACARLCKGYSHCMSFAFDRSAGVCHLHPVLAAGIVSVNSRPTLRAYTDTDPICKQGTLQVPNGIPIQWRRSLTSAEANATCKSDYMLNKNDAVVRCTSDGQLTPTDVQCLQRIWRNPVGNIRVPIPRNVTVGWTLCISGTPTDSFDVDIEAGNSSNVPVHTTWNLSPVALLSTMSVGETLLDLSSLLTTALLASFPLNVAGVVRFAAVSSTQVSIFANSQHVYTKQLSLPLSTFSHVAVKGSITVSSLDVWCGQ